MTQADLDFGMRDQADRAFRRVLSAVDDAVAELGLANAAAACDTSRSSLSDALSQRENRYLRVEWFVAIMFAASAERREAILRALAGSFGLDVQTPLSDKERADRLEGAMRAMPLGEQLVALALGGRR